MRVQRLQDMNSTFNFSKTAATIVACTGSISAMSSIMTLVTICRSRDRFSSVYNRIMIGMCTFDIIVSTTMALSSIPMPVGQIYPFERTYGTWATCEAQAFLFILGSCGCLLYSTGLSLFHLCLIRYQMSEQVIRSFIEPLIHLCSVSIPFTIAIILHSLDLLNPAPNYPWSFYAVYPHDCILKDGVECIRGNLDHINLAHTLIGVTMGSGILFVITSMLIIIYNTNCKKKHMHGRNNGGGFRYRQQLRAAKELQKVLTQQACMYISACVITWIFPMLRFFTLFENVDALSVLSLVFWPLQGFFNALIFIYQKVHNIQRCDSSVTFLQALRFVFLNPDELPEWRLSGLSRVDLNNEMREGNRLQQSVGEESTVGKNVHVNHSNPSSLSSHSSSVVYDTLELVITSDVTLNDKKSEMGMDRDFIFSYDENNASTEEKSYTSEYIHNNAHVTETIIFPIQSNVLLSGNSKSLHLYEDT